LHACVHEAVPGRTEARRNARAAGSARKDMRLLDPESQNFPKRMKRMDRLRLLEGGCGGKQDFSFWLHFLHG